MSQKQTFQLIYLNSLMLQNYDVQQIRTQVTVFLTSQRKIKYYISLVSQDQLFYFLQGSQQHLAHTVIRTEFLTLQNDSTSQGNIC